jgi:hypothetical protein
MPICQVNCLSTYSCNSGLIAPFDGSVFEPFVILYCGDFYVTGGNYSTIAHNSKNEFSITKNLASISSFSYGAGGTTSSFGAEFEIIDVGGTMYRQIIHAINKTVANQKGESRLISFDFGWVVKKCDGSVELKNAKSFAGSTFHGYVAQVETTFEGNNVKMKLVVSCPSFSAKEVPQNTSEGSQDSPVSLKDAIRGMFLNKEPSYSVVEFRSKDDDGTGGFKPLAFKNSDGGPDGPKASWPMNQQSTLAAARSWLNSLATNNEKGVQLLFDPKNYSLVVQEDKLKAKCCEYNIGTYIVNGGNCSPVLEFTPEVGPFVMGQKQTGAANPGSASGAGSKVGNITPGIEEAGTQAQPTIPYQDWSWRIPDDLASGVAEGIAAQYDANVLVERPQTVGGKLKIMGDPRYHSIDHTLGVRISLIVINPFHVGNTCVWLTESNCNSILSNKNYMIIGFNHQISGGSYVTILDLALEAPNANIPASEGLGSCGDKSNEGNVGKSENKKASDKSN